MNKSALLAALTPVVKEVTLEGVGPIRLRQLSVNEVTAAREADASGKVEFGLRLVTASVVDDAGQALLSVDDLTELRKASHVAMDAIVAEVLKLNGFVLEGAAPKT